MRRISALLLAVAIVGLACAQEPPKGDPKKAEPKKDIPKTDPMPPAEEVDVHKTAERIADNAQKAGDRLKEKDPGADTRKIQSEIIKDIDALIKKAQNPPPPPMNSDMSPMPPPPMSDTMPPPKGGAGNGPMPKSPMGMGTGGTSGNSKPERRPRREHKPQGNSPMGMGDPMPKDGMGGNDPMAAKPDPKDGKNSPANQKENSSGDRFGMTSPKRQNDKLADLYKDVWGHLPDRLRQEMDLYYREKFMPRYSELLRQYYATLAEQRKNGSEDRK
jgi:hypothetical protein